jgi:hypothetical protein
MCFSIYSSPLKLSRASLRLLGSCCAALALSLCARRTLLHCVVVARSLSHLPARPPPLLAHAPQQQAPCGTETSAARRTRWAPPCSSTSAQSGAARSGAAVCALRGRCSAAACTRSAGHCLRAAVHAGSRHERRFACACQQPQRFALLRHLNTRAVLGHARAARPQDAASAHHGGGDRQRARHLRYDGWGQGKPRTLCSSWCRPRHCCSLRCSLQRGAAQRQPHAPPRRAALWRCHAGVGMQRAELVRSLLRRHGAAAGRPARPGAGNLPGVQHTRHHVRQGGAHASAAPAGTLAVYRVLVADAHAALRRRCSPPRCRCPAR